MEGPVLSGSVDSELRSAMGESGIPKSLRALGVCMLGIASSQWGRRSIRHLVFVGVLFCLPGTVRSKFNLF